MVEAQPSWNILPHPHAETGSSPILPRHMEQSFSDSQSSRKWVAIPPVDRVEATFFLSETSLDCNAMDTKIAKAEKIPSRYTVLARFIIQ